MQDLEEAVTHRDRSDCGGEAGPLTQPQVKADCTEKRFLPGRKAPQAAVNSFCAMPHFTCMTTLHGGNCHFHLIEEETKISGGWVIPS